MKSVLFLLCLFVFSQASQEPQGITPEDVMNFVKGLMDGLNEQGDINALIKCLNGTEKVIEDIIDALEMIKTKKTDQIILGISKLVKAVSELIELFKPCSEGFEQIKKLMMALKNINFQKLLVKVLSNLNRIIALVTSCVEAFRTKQFKPAGDYLGKLLLMLFLTDSPVNLEVNDLFKALVAFFNALNGEKHIDNIYKCVAVLPPIIEKIKIIIDSLDWSDIKNIIKSLNALLDIIKGLTDAITPCFSIKDDFKTLWAILKKLDATSITTKLMLNLPRIITSISLFAEYLSEGEYEKAGKEIGGLLYHIFLKGEKP